MGEYGWFCNLSTKALPNSCSPLPFRYEKEILSLNTKHAPEKYHLVWPLVQDKFLGKGSWSKSDLVCFLSTLQHYPCVWANIILFASLLIPNGLVVDSSEDPVTKFVAFKDCTCCIGMQYLAQCLKVNMKSYCHFSATTYSPSISTWLHVCSRYTRSCVNSGCKWIWW